jgi:hypothetical protein
MMSAVECRFVIERLGKLGAALIGSDPETRQANRSDTPNDALRRVPTATVQRISIENCDPARAFFDQRNINSRHKRHSATTSALSKQIQFASICNNFTLRISAFHFCINARLNPKGLSSCLVKT